MAVRNQCFAVIFQNHLECFTVFFIILEQVHLGQKDLIGLVSTLHQQITIVGVDLTAQETDVALVKHVGTTLIRGPTVLVQLIEIGGLGIHKKVGIVGGCNQTKD